MIGGYDRSKPEEFEEVRMESWFIHEGYNANLNLHDIALIKLAAPSSRTPARLNIVCRLPALLHAYSLPPHGIKPALSSALWAPRFNLRQ